MAYSLVYYGNKTLAEVAKPVDNIDSSVASIIDSMFEIMYNERGIGLAAPQIDLGKRIIVVDTQEKKRKKIALVNPVLKHSSDETNPFEEGCLSIPGVNADVIRPSEVVVSGYDRDGNEVEIETGGLYARVLQHEIDHLNGVLFIDRIEKYIRNEFRSELKKIRKMNR